MTGYAQKKVKRKRVPDDPAITALPDQPHEPYKKGEPVDWYYNDGDGFGDWLLGHHDNLEAAIAAVPKMTVYKRPAKFPERSKRPAGYWVVCRRSREYLGGTGNKHTIKMLKKNGLWRVTEATPSVTTSTLVVSPKPTTNT